jgi:very-short-patch-repair endonuclease
MSEQISLDVPGAILRKADGPEDVFAAHCRRFMLPPFEQQLRFAKHIGRQWRFDFAWPQYWLAVELDGVNVRRIGGQLVVSGRHASIEGIRGDHEKINTAILLGWSVLRFLQTDVKPQLAIETTMRVLAARGWQCGTR